MSDQRQAEVSTSTPTVVETPVSTDPAPEGTQPLSKKAQKRAAKQEQWEAKKLERRAREREVKKEKKRILAEKRAAGELEDDVSLNKKAKKRKIDFGGRVVVDLGFDELMNDKEVKSLCSQLAYTYSVNRQASFPFDLIFSSLNGRTLDRLESMGDQSYKRWMNTQWWSEGFERLWGGKSPPPTSVEPSEPVSSHSKSDEPQAPVVVVAEMNLSAPEPSPDPERTPAQEKIVYLTADCDEELTELKQDETYIIGGIVDHNRYKNLCLNKAKSHNLRVAKLPIGSYLSNMPTRKVLTVNQCFEILVKWVETRNWEEALYSVIPQRKFAVGSAKAGSKGGSVQIGVNDGEADAEGEVDDADVREYEVKQGVQGETATMEVEVEAQ